MNFPVTDGGSFVIFASDLQGIEFLPGRTLTLVASFSDGSTATAVTTVSTPATLTVAFNGSSCATGSVKAMWRWARMEHWTGR